MKVLQLSIKEYNKKRNSSTLVYFMGVSESVQFSPINFLGDLTKKQKQVLLYAIEKLLKTDIENSID